MKTSLPWKGTMYQSYKQVIALMGQAKIKSMRSNEWGSKTGIHYNKQSRSMKLTGLICIKMDASD